MEDQLKTNKTRTAGTNHNAAVALGHVVSTAVQN
jgi:hypothetical protein